MNENEQTGDQGVVDMPYVTVTAQAYGLTIDVTVTGYPQDGGHEGFDHVADLVAIAAAAAEHALPTSPEFDAETQA
jgi:hypothetical protein